MKKARPIICKALSWLKASLLTFPTRNAKVLLRSHSFSVWQRHFNPEIVIKASGMYWKALKAAWAWGENIAVNANLQLRAQSRRRCHPKDLQHWSFRIHASSPLSLVYYSSLDSIIQSEPGLALQHVESILTSLQEDDIWGSYLFGSQIDAILSMVSMLAKQHPFRRIFQGPCFSPDCFASTALLQAWRVYFVWSRLISITAQSARGSLQVSFLPW